MAIAGGHAAARAVQTGVKLGIFDVIDTGAHSAEAIAAAVSADERATRILCDALAALGIIVKSAGRYDLSDGARKYLLRRSENYVGGMIEFDDALWPVWERLDPTVRTGAPARTPDMFQGSPAQAERFIRAMDSLVRARGDARWVADNLDLSNVGVIADVGGGPGSYVAAMIRRWPHLRARIYDLPATLEVARRIIAEREPDIAARIELVEADYTKREMPGPVDALFMSNIVHSEDEATNAELIGKCFRALRPGGVIFIKDHVMDRELVAPQAGAVFALYLMLTTRGRDYSFDEISGWVAAAGFKEIKSSPLPEPRFTSSIVSAKKPQ
jgi:SAM-dependent methyltransferase